jgi:hypothetical protein
VIAGTALRPDSRRSRASLKSVPRNLSEFGPLLLLSLYYHYGYGYGDGVSAGARGQGS